MTVFVYGRLLYTLGCTDNDTPSQTDNIALGHDKKKLSYTYKGEVRKFYDDVNSWTTSVHSESYFDYLSQIDAIDCFVIYSNLVAPTQAPDGAFNILRTCPIKSSGSSDSRTIQIFSNPDYLPLSRNHFESISVSLRTIFGAPLPLQGGFVRLRCHFRPRITI